jgi:DNA excision repair protein ERCC-6
LLADPLALADGDSDSDSDSASAALTLSLAESSGEPDEDLTAGADATLDSGLVDDDKQPATGPQAQAGGGRRRVRLRDDADDKVFAARMAALAAERAVRPEPAPQDVEFTGGFVMPGALWDKLLRYQQTSIKWMWELHRQGAGGIIADEMGLGKTLQTIAFLTGLLHTTTLLTAAGAPADSALWRRFRPVLILCPATVMAHWLKEFRRWSPDMRVMLFHESGGHDASRRELLQTLLREGHVLVSTYESVRIYKDSLLPLEWGYVILDEGHRIRNPDTQVSVVCKQLLTEHRLVLTGAPLQNNLNDIWSLMDFAYPGKLGTALAFAENFSDPITRGGYTNASALDVQLAYKCAVVLRDLINPYVLRREKKDVALDLPSKTEQVLFCELTQAQRAAYTKLLRARLVEQAQELRGEQAGGSYALLSAITMLRKCCNHPDLLGTKLVREGDQPAGLADYGSPDRSGKLLVLQQVLRMWHQQGHRVLVFAQTRQVSVGRACGLACGRANTHRSAVSACVRAVRSLSR